jgi:ABC-2 type transport system permease protein
MSTLAICWDMVLISAREQMQYRANFLIEVGFGLVYQTIGFAFIWVVVGQFSAIGGWSLAEVTLLYGLQLAGQSLWALAFSRLMLIEGLVREGEYDRMLVRPLPLALQFMFGGFRIATLGEVLSAVVLLVAGVTAVDIAWTVPKGFYFVLAIAGSAMIWGAFQLIPAALVFRYQTSTPTWILSGFFEQFAGYPLTIFERRLRGFLTFLVPVAFIAWVPGAVLLDRTAELPVPAWIAWCSPLIGVVLLALAWWIFLRESRMYQSTGS